MPSGKSAVHTWRSSAARPHSRRRGSRLSKMWTSTISIPSRSGNSACAASVRCSWRWIAQAVAFIRRSMMPPGAGAKERCGNLALESAAHQEVKTRRITMQLIIRALALLVFAVTAQAQNISIATGGTGGVYYPLGGGMAAMLSKYVPGIQATAEVTGGFAANRPRSGNGKRDLRIALDGATPEGHKGEEKFKRKPVHERPLLIISPNRMY